MGAKKCGVALPCGELECGQYDRLKVVLHEYGKADGGLWLMATLIEWPQT
ncbi:MAG: hypothetical protein V3S55_00990 [Nitrospiraceae bacterium]